MKSVMRRHGKIIMAFMGVVLMVVFTLPAFNSGRDTSGDTVGRINGTRVANRDISYAAFEIELIKDLNREIMLYDLELDERNPPIHWMLLVKEAEKYGFDSISPSYDEIVQSLSQGYPPFIPPMPAERVQDILHNKNASRDNLVAAFKHLGMIQQLRNFALNVPQPVAAVELLADQQLTKVRVAYTLFDAVKAAGEGAATQAAPSAEEQQKQFDVYKNVARTRIPTNPNAPVPPLPPVINGHRYPFGYKYPDRVKVEYLVFDRAKVRESIKETQEDYDEAYKYYVEHPAEFANAGQGGGTLSTQPAKRSFDEVKGSLVARQIDARVNRMITRMVERVRAQAADPWKNAPIDLKGFKETLAAEKWASYQKLGDDLAKNREFQGFKPEYKAFTAEWLDVEALENIPGIGAAVYSPSDRSEELSFPRLATHVRELAELTARDPLGRLFLQKGVEGPTIQDPQKNVYIYRVVDAARSAEPKSLDEVRPRVVEDLRLLASYKRQRQAAQDLASAANKGDLPALAGARNLSVQTTPEFSRLDTELPEAVQRINGFVEAAYKLVPGNASAASQPASTQPTGVNATTTLDNDNTLKVYTLQMQHISPAKPGDFAAKRMELMRSADPGLIAFSRNWFTLDALVARMNYTPPFPPRKNEEG